ncbi:MAG: phosphoglycerate dehydrogenase [Gemmatimonadetes bacterium]|nr:phosphoglycerate dehydrogenase [Gemmatimonadota bacterium]
MSAAQTAAANGGKYTVVVADGISESGLRPLLDDKRFNVVVVNDKEQLEAALPTADALIVRSATKVTKELLAKAGNIQVIGRAGVGVDNIDQEAATVKGAAVLNAPAGNTVSAAELTMALILAAVRKVAAADRSTRAGEWKRAKFGGVELRGRTLGLVGAGRIGGEVAKRARAFGMHVIAYDPYLTAERAQDLGVERVELAEVKKRADVVSLHVPLTEQTKNMFGEAQLRELKQGAFLVNVARGGVIDEAALVRVLADGHLAGAALDVFDNEPLEKDSPLLSAENLVLTPHLGASTTEAQELVAEEIAEAVRAALADGDLSRALNAPAIGGEAFKRMKPMLDLGTKLGRLASGLALGGIKGIEVRYAGEAEEAPRPLTAYVLMGLLGTILGEDQVNFVNAPHLAATRGIGVATHKLNRRPDYTEFVEVKISGEKGETRVAGVLLGEHPRVVRIGDYHVDVVPQGSLVVLRNRDVPGVIGKVGTLLGGLGLNIAEYHQARLAAGGEALAAIAIDGTVEPAALAKLKELPEVLDARVVQLG